MDVNPPVTVRARAASAAAGAYQGRYRLMDIDRSPFASVSSRFYGALRVQVRSGCTLRVHGT